MLTILSQNSADINAEQAFESLRRAFPRAVTAADPGTPPIPGTATDAGTTPPDMPRAAWPGAQGIPAAADQDATALPRINRPGWGGIGLEDAIAPAW